MKSKSCSSKEQLKEAFQENKPKKPVFHNELDFHQMSDAVEEDENGNDTFSGSDSDDGFSSSQSGCGSTRTKQSVGKSSNRGRQQSKGGGPSRGKGGRSSSGQEEA